MFLGKRESRSSPNTLETFASSCPWSMFHWTGGDQVNRMLTAVFFPLGQWHVRVHPRLLWRRCWADLCPLQAVSLVLRVQKLATSLLTKTWFFFTFLFSVVPLACEDEPGEILSSTAIAGDEEGDVRRSHSLLPVSKTLNSIYPHETKFTPIFAMILRSINLFTLSFHSFTQAVPMKKPCRKIHRRSRSLSPCNEVTSRRPLQQVCSNQVSLNGLLCPQELV
jgi:hypothetical protein